MFFFLLFFRPHNSTLFPYTTLFRSPHPQGDGGIGEEAFARARREEPVHRVRRRRSRQCSRSEEHTSELQSHSDLVCRLLLEKKKRPPATRLWRTTRRSA